MKVFISSVVSGFEALRGAAADAAHVLGHEVKRSEDFPAMAVTPQQACLEGVRWADVVILLLGPRYGEPLQSGLSATHEEYREAQQRRHVLAFVQGGVDPEPSQRAFIDEVRRWESGRPTGSFSTPEELRDAVIKALHELEFSMLAGEADEEEMLARGRTLLSDVPAGWAAPTLTLVVVGGPRQVVLRPSDLESPELERDLIREALLGDAPVLDTHSGTRSRVDGNHLLLEQQDASICVDDLGSVRIVQPALPRRDRDAGLPALIEEDVADRLRRAINTSAWILDRVDPLHRLAVVVPVAELRRVGAHGWRTREEHAKTPGSMTLNINVDGTTVTLSPPRRARAALKNQTGQLVEDLLALLRREMRPRS